MLFLVLNLLYWTQTGATYRRCTETSVIIYGDNVVLHAGEGFKLSCEFKCLEAPNIAQLWKNKGYEGGVCLVNVSSIQPNVTLSIHISSVTKADTGYYSCTFNPFDTISQIFIDVVEDSGNFTTFSLTTPSMPMYNYTQQPTSAAGVQGQMWYWMLLGKTAVFLLCLASVAIKYKRL